MQKTKELRELSTHELQELSLTMRRQKFDLNNARRASQQQVQPHELKHARKTLARILTILGERERNQ